MKQIYKLTSWNLRLAAGPVLAVWILWCITNYLYQISGSNNANSYVNEYLANGAFVLILISYLAVLSFCAMPVWRSLNGKTKAVYTFYTLPISRTKLLVSNITASLLAVLASISFFSFAILASYPFILNTVKQFTMTKSYNREFDSAFTNFANNFAARIIFPTDFKSLLLLLLFVFCTTVLFCCISAFKGIMKIVSIISFIAGAGGAVFYFFLSYRFSLYNTFNFYVDPMNGHKWVLILCLVILTLLIFWRAIVSVKHSKNL